MVIGIILVVIAIGIGLAIGLKQRQGTQQLMQDGRILKRDITFVETAEIFTLSGAEFNSVVEAIRNTDLSGTGASADQNLEKQAVLFKGSDWSAQLYRMENDGDKAVYCFNFLKWQTYRGMPQNHVPMNLLLTAIEKMFLQLDPNAQVQASRMKSSSRPNFF